MRFLEKIELIKNDILGKKYDLSVAYVSKSKSKELNHRYRGKNKPTNVLSFSLYKNMGELVLCKPLIEQEAKKIHKTLHEWLGFLVIHGMLHLKGYEHSSTMEELEQKYDKKYFYRHRRGLVKNTSRRRRIYNGRKKS